MARWPGPPSRHFSHRGGEGGQGRAVCTSREDGAGPELTDPQHTGMAATHHEARDFVQLDRSPWRRPPALPADIGKTLFAGLAVRPRRYRTLEVGIPSPLHPSDPSPEVPFRSRRVPLPCTARPSNRTFQCLPPALASNCRSIARSHSKRTVLFEPCPGEIMAESRTTSSAAD